MDAREREETLKEIKLMKYVADEYKKDNFGVYGVFTFDV